MAPPCAMVIFGAAGDLTKRLVVPALYNLATAQQLSDGFRLVGVDLRRQEHGEWRAGLTDTMKEFVGHDGEFQLDRIRPERVAVAHRPHELSAGRPQRSRDLSPAWRASGGAGQDSRHGR